MLGETLILLRKKQGYSQQEVADLIHVTRQTISNWECDQGAPSLDKAKLLAELYNVSLDDLVGNDVQFVTKKQKEVSALLMNLIGKRCKLDDKGLQNITLPSEVRILSINEDWIKVSYERNKENAVWKKERITQYIELSAINGFMIMEEA